jgi:hypothetical protein
MRIYINEYSFSRAFGSRDEINNLLKQLVQVSQSAKRLSNNEAPRRHRDLKLKEILPGLTLENYLHEIGKHSSPKVRTLKQLFLETFAKAPFLVFAHGSDDSVMGEEQICLKGSCFDDAAASDIGAAVISIADEENQAFYQIDSSIHGQRKVLNLSTVEQVDENVWVYESNPKHEISKDLLVDGETYSAMDLSLEDSQKLLSNGIKCGKSVYGKKNGKWYKFHRHMNNRFHGFPVIIRVPYKDYIFACQLHEKIGENAGGQIFSELLSNKV